MVKKYIEKPRQVEALQWTGHNIDEALKFCAEQVFDYCENKNYFQLWINTWPYIDTQAEVKIGDYIVKYNKKNCTIWQESDFIERFQEL